MATQLQLGGIAVDVLLKDIKNVHLSVHPPTGRVRISAPARMSLDLIRVFAISKLNWIKQQQKKLREQERETPREYLERESHFVWGKRYLLSVTERDRAPAVELKHSRMILTARAGMDEAAKEVIVAQWYRDQVKAVVADLVAKWESILAVNVNRVFVQQMKTKWGSCNPRAGTIRLNTELAKKPKECLEYIVVHEMVHLLEPTHNARFVALMDQFVPRWKFLRQRLNRLPVRHADWDY
jgi:predicted metal-dependent hydrolase